MNALLLYHVLSYYDPAVGAGAAAVAPTNQGATGISRAQARSVAGPAPGGPLSAPPLALAWSSPMARRAVERVAPQGYVLPGDLSVRVLSWTVDTVSAQALHGRSRVVVLRERVAVTVGSPDALHVGLPRLHWWFARRPSYRAGAPPLQQQQQQQERQGRRHALAGGSLPRWTDEVTLAGVVPSPGAPQGGTTRTRVPDTTTDVVVKRAFELAVYLSPAVALDDGWTVGHSASAAEAATLPRVEAWRRRTRTGLLAALHTLLAAPADLGCGGDREDRPGCAHDPPMSSVGPDQLRASAAIHTLRLSPVDVVLLGELLGAHTRGEGGVGSSGGGGGHEDRIHGKAHESLTHTLTSLSLDTWGPALSDLAALSPLTALTALDVSRSRLVSLAALSTSRYAHGLTSLTLRECRLLSDLSALRQCPQLRHLDASGCGVVSLDGLEGTPQLAELHLAACRALRFTAATLTTLGTLRRLRWLDLANTYVQDLAWVLACTELETLVVAGCPLLMTLPPTLGGQLRRLRVLRAGSSGLTDLRWLDPAAGARAHEAPHAPAVSPLEMLEELDLSECHQVVDWAPLVRFRQRHGAVQESGSTHHGRERVARAAAHGTPTAHTTAPPHSTSARSWAHQSRAAGVGCGGGGGSPTRREGLQTLRLTCARVADLHWLTGTRDRPPPSAQDDSGTDNTEVRGGVGGHGSPPGPRGEAAEWEGARLRHGSGGSSSSSSNSGPAHPRPSLSLSWTRAPRRLEDSLSRLFLCACGGLDLRPLARLTQLRVLSLDASELEGLEWVRPRTEPVFAPFPPHHHPRRHVPAQGAKGGGGGESAGCSVASLSPTRTGLARLEELYLSHCSTLKNNLSPVASLPRLRKLFLSDHSTLTDVAWLVEPTAVDIHAAPRGRAGTSPALPPAARALEALFIICAPQLRAVDPVGALPRLRQLHVVGTGLRSVDFLAHRACACAGVLEVLTVSFSKSLTDLSPVGYAPRLRILHAANSGVRQLTSGDSRRYRAYEARQQQRLREHQQQQQQQEQERADELRAAGATPHARVRGAPPMLDARGTAGSPAHPLAIVRSLVERCLLTPRRRWEVGLMGVLSPTLARLRLSLRQRAEQDGVERGAGVQTCAGTAAAGRSRTGGEPRHADSNENSDSSSSSSRASSRSGRATVGRHTRSSASEEKSEKEESRSDGPHCRADVHEPAAPAETRTWMRRGLETLGTTLLDLIAGRTRGGAAHSSTISSDDSFAIDPHKFDYASVAQCAALEAVSLGYCPALTDASALGSLSSLRVLDLAFSDIRSVHWLRGCVRLEVLTLYGNPRLPPFNATPSVPPGDSQGVDPYAVLHVLPRLGCVNGRRFYPGSAATEGHET